MHDGLVLGYQVVQKPESGIQGQGAKHLAAFIMAQGS